MIKETLVDVDDPVARPLRDGHYDLLSPDGHIISPQVWETTVQPYWNVTMRLWPMSESPQPIIPPYKSPESPDAEQEPKSPTASPPLPSPPPEMPCVKIDAIAHQYNTEIVPLCTTFLENPPVDKAKRQIEHEKLTETISSQVLLKLHDVVTEGDQEAREKRRGLAGEAQWMLNRLDAVLKLISC